MTLDQQHLARFEREAQLLASPNHPNIAQIYGLEERDENAPPPAPSPITVVVNWREQLKRQR